MPRSPHALHRELTLASILILFSASSSLAASMVSDPVGDFVVGSPCNGHVCEPWQDITQASVAHVAGGLHLTMMLVDAIPAQPVLQSGLKKVDWAWRFDTDPTTFPKGYPLPNGADSPFEAIVALEWDGTAFSGRTIDRRPLLTGGDAIVTPIVVNVSGNQLTVDVPSSTLALPASFAWRASTNGFTSLEPSGGQYPIDVTAFATANPGD
jgi:hypothetical protein